MTRKISESNIQTTTLESLSGGGGSGTTAYDTIAELPLSGVEDGEMALVLENNRLYIWNGTGWFNIALLNTNPTITSGPNAGYVLAKDGTPTVLTLIASDPEGLPIIWSYQVTSGSLGSTATIVQSGNQFTITPGTDAGDVGTFGVTFTASDGVNIATAASTFTLVFSAADTRYNQSIVLTTSSVNNANNNTFIDSSTNNFAITRNGNATQGAFSPHSPAGWSAYFDGASDDLTVASNDAFKLGTGNFTVEMWINPTKFTGAATGTLFNIGTFATGLFIRITISNINVYVVNNERLNISRGTIITTNTWYHLALVRNGSTFTLYVNGSSVGTFTDSSSISPTDATIMIAKSAHNGTETHVGYISNLRLVKGTAIYTANFTPPTEPLTAVAGTSLLTLQDNRFIDRSTNNFAITVVDNPRITPFSPFVPIVQHIPSIHGGSAYFDGSGDYLSIPNNTALGMGTGNFTIEFWIYQTARGSIRQILDIADGNSAGRLILWVDTGGTLINLGSNGGSRHSTAGGAIVLNSWIHVALVRSSGTTKFYINGIQSGTDYADSTNYTCTTGSVHLGINSDGSTYPLNGYLSNFRIVKGTAVYTAAFTPPTAPLTAVANTNLLLNFTNAGIFDETGKVVLETVGNARASTAVAKYGATSMFFDGTGDYLSAPYDPVLMDWWTSNYTLEAWVYPTSFSGWSYVDGVSGLKPVLIGNKEFNSATHYWGFGLTTTGTLYFAYFNGSPQGAGTSSTATLNTWNHIAMVKNGTNVTLYLNGVGTSIGNVSGTPQSAANTPLTIGAGNNAYINGYVQDLRITKGHARYTANFTPPTAKLGYSNAE